MRTNRMTPFVALLACCVAVPAFAQTQTQTQTPTSAQSQTAQPQPPAQPQPATTAQPTPPVQTQPATTAQPMTPVQPTTPTPVGTTGTSSVADTNHGTEILLLDRVQKVLDKAVADAKGGQVTIDRGLLDEMRAEVAQVKASLQGQKP